MDGISPRETHIEQSIQYRQKKLLFIYR